MNKLKYVKLENPDGTYSDSIPLSVDSDYVDINGNTLTSELDKKASKNDLTTLTSRVDNLAHLEEGSTTGDAELIDGRISYNGYHFNNLGTAVRKQVNTLHEDIRNIIKNSEDEVISLIHTIGEINYQSENLPANSDYVYNFTVINESSNDGYFLIRRYNGDNYSGSKTENIILHSGESLSINTPFNTNSPNNFRIENPNNNKKCIIITKRKHIVENKNILFNYQFVTNEYNATSLTNPQAFPKALIPSNHKNRFIKIKNNTSNASYFGVKIEDEQKMVFDNRTNPILVNSNSEVIFDVGAIDVRYIFINNDNLNTDFTLSLFEEKEREIVTCGSTRKYKKLVDAIEYINTKGNCDLFIDSGEYDIISEIGEENLQNYIKSNSSGHGLLIGKNNRLYFESGAIVKCEYTGDNRIVNRDFSIFNVSTKTDFGDFEIHGGIFIGKNIRYIIHDEATGISQYTHKYFNCQMKLNNTNNPNWSSKQCIGGGLGQNGTIIIDGGIYESIGIENQNDKGVITYHNPDHGTSSIFKNLVVIKNVYFENGTCYVSCLGDDTSYNATIFECSNNSMLHEPFANGIDNPNVNHNVLIKK